MLVLSRRFCQVRDKRPYIQLWCVARSRTVVDLSNTATPLVSCLPVVHQRAVECENVERRSALPQHSPSTRQVCQEVTLRNHPCPPRARRYCTGQWRTAAPGTKEYATTCQEVGSVAAEASPRYSSSTTPTLTPPIRRVAISASLSRRSLSGSWRLEVARCGDSYPLYSRSSFRRGC